MATMSAEHDVIGLEIRTDSGCDCFLADVSMARPVNQPLLVTAGELFFRLADYLHRAIQRGQDVLCRTVVDCVHERCFSLHNLECRRHLAPGCRHPWV